MKFSTIAPWVEAISGFEPDLLGGRALERLIAERMRAAGVSDEAAYLTRLQTDQGELERLFAGVSVPETSFFRYPASYDMLGDWLARRRGASNGSARLRMASLACATGEEPCSMVITAAHSGWDLERIHVDAWDRNPLAIARARTGRYPVAALGPGVPDWARLSFLSEDNHVRVLPSTLSVIEYRHGNVLELPPAPPPRYDVIFCRNLLIYFNAASRRALLAWLAQSLAADGRLFLGHAECGPAVEGDFVPVETPRAFAFSLRPAPVPVPRPMQKPPPALPRTAVVPTKAPPNARELKRSAPSLDEAQALADRGELRPAVVMARAVLETTGPSPAVLELLGTIQLAFGDVQQAHDYFFRAVYLDPKHEPSLLQLALICDRLGDSTQASRYRQRAGRAQSS